MSNPDETGRDAPAGSVVPARPAAARATAPRAASATTRTPRATATPAHRGTAADGTAPADDSPQAPTAPEVADTHAVPDAAPGPEGGPAADSPPTAGPTAPATGSTGSRAAGPAEGRPPRLPRSARRKQLLAAATEVFGALGYHAAAMDQIAERAGVSKPVLYQHFPGKLELYLALVEHHTEDLVTRLETALTSTDDNRRRVAATMGAYFDFVVDHGDAFRLVFESDVRNEPLVREQVESALNRCTQAITRVIAGDTGVTPDQAHLLAVALQGMAETSARNWLKDRRTVSQQQAVRFLAGLAWRGISGFPKVEEQLDEWLPAAPARQPDPDAEPPRAESPRTGTPRAESTAPRSPRARKAGGGSATDRPRARRRATPPATPDSGDRTGHEGRARTTPEATD